MTPGMSIPPSQPTGSGSMTLVHPGSAGPLPKEYVNYYDLFVEIFMKNNN